MWFHEGAAEHKDKPPPNGEVCPYLTPFIKQHIFRYLFNFEDLETAHKWNQERGYAFISSYMRNCFSCFFFAKKTTVCPLIISIQSSKS